MTTRRAKIAAPQLPAVVLPELEPVPSDGAFVGRAERHEALLFDRTTFEGRDLGGSDFIECQFSGVNLNEAQLRGATFRESVLAEPFAPVLMAARSTWQDVQISNPRWGSAELYEGGWRSVTVDGGKLDYVNLRGSSLMDVQFKNCIIGELDLAQCKAQRISFSDCSIGTLDVSGAKLKDVDLRTTEFSQLNGLGSLEGLVIDEYQLSLLAPLLAAHLGISVR
ncbi:pentapeptide repeat-containing protein [Pseudarthrobacter sp. J1738]|uniref:pentapeptide repeat-containing protein n=1 Tax=unclassified Pseudarthrobacter TaxID=2647000 RepID=UPI003D27B7C8